MCVCVCKNLKIECVLCVCNRDIDFIEEMEIYNVVEKKIVCSYVCFCRF